MTRHANPWGMTGEELHRAVEHGWQFAALLRELVSAIDDIDAAHTSDKAVRLEAILANARKSVGLPAPQPQERED